MTDPQTFAAAILYRDLSAEHARLLRDSSRRLLVLGGRDDQDVLIAIKALHYGMTNPFASIVIVCPTAYHARSIMRTIIEIAQNSRLKRLVRRKWGALMLTNGSRIAVLVAGRKGLTLRGHVAHLVIVIDALSIPSRVIEDAIFPMLATTDGICWFMIPRMPDHAVYRILMLADMNVHALGS